MPSITERAIKASHRAEQRRTQCQTTARQRKQEKQEQRAREAAEKNRKYERNALRFLRKQFRAAATVCGWGHEFPHSQVEVKNGWLGNTNLILEVPKLPFLVVYWKSGELTGLLPYCADCNEVLAHQKNPINGFRTYQLIRNLTELGNYLRAYKAHECPKQRGAQDRATTQAT